jgi:hypothetical protein
MAFNSDHPLPLFLADELEQQVLADELEQQGIGKAWEGAVIRLLLKASILVATATAIFVAIILWVGNPATTLSADVTASPVDKSVLQPGPDQSTPTIQSTADAQASIADARALPPAAKDAPTRDEMAAATEPADQIQTKNSERDTLFRQFQAWAVDKDARAPVGPVQPAQDAQAKLVQNAHVRPVHHARSEIRPVQNPRKKAPREQTARAEVPPAQDARAQDQPMRNFLQIFSWRN